MKIGEKSSKTSAFLPFSLFFLLALILRFLYLIEIKNTEAFLLPTGDGFLYYKQALEITTGHWRGNEAFYQTPFYPYFLALVFILLGENLTVIRSLQILLGALACLLLALAGKSFFSKRVGMITGLLAALYPVNIFFDCLIQKTTFDFFFSALLLFFLTRLFFKHNLYYFFFSGIILGLFTLNRENTLVYVPLILIWILTFFRKYPSKSKVIWLLSLIGGFLLIIMPVSFRNWSKGGNFWVTSGFGSNFYLANNPKANGLYIPLRWGRGDAFFERYDATEIAQMSLKRKLSPAEVSSFWFDQAWHFICTSPLTWIKATVKKLMLIWNKAEIPDTDPLEIYLDSSFLLRILYYLFNFGILAPVGLTGMFVAWKVKNQIAILYLMFLGMATSLPLFLAFARYRFVLIPFLILFAGVFISDFGEYLKEKRYCSLLRYGIILFFSTIFVNFPAYTKSGDEHRALGYYNLAVTLTKTCKFQKAEVAFLKALQLRPNRPLYHVKYSFFLANLERYPEAVSHMLKALSLSSGVPIRKQCNELAKLLLNRREIEAALTCYTRLLELEPDNPIWNFNAGYALSLKGDLPGALILYKKALQLKPDLKEAQAGLEMIMGKERVPSK